ncbi:MAG: hypothetical protein IJ272_05195 [Clostridia bacterium]|nr:hypothetical protein [Clostridia bacterium]
MTCCKNLWKITCTKDFVTSTGIKIAVGTTLDVKDKFPGKSGLCDDGVWEVKDGLGGLFNISAKERKEFFNS